MNDLKDTLAAIYGTLKKLEMPMTPNNAKNMAGLFLKLEEMYAQVADQEHAEQEQRG